MVRRCLTCPLVLDQSDEGIFSGCPWRVPKGRRDKGPSSPDSCIVLDMPTMCPALFMPYALLTLPNVPRSTMRLLLWERKAWLELLSVRQAPPTTTLSPLMSPAALVPPPMVFNVLHGSVGQQEGVEGGIPVDVRFSDHHSHVVDPVRGAHTLPERAQIGHDAVTAEERVIGSSVLNVE